MAQNKKQLDQRIVNEIVQSITAIQFGEVVVTIHNAQVVQIEKKEKKRFN